MIMIMSGIDDRWLNDSMIIHDNIWHKAGISRADRTRADMTNMLYQFKRPTNLPTIHQSLSVTIRSCQLWLPLATCSSAPNIRAGWLAVKFFQHNAFPLVLLCLSGCHVVALRQDHHRVMRRWVEKILVEETCVQWQVIQCIQAPLGWQSCTAWRRFS